VPFLRRTRDPISLKELGWLSGALLAFALFPAIGIIKQSIPAQIALGLIAALGASTAAGYLRYLKVPYLAALLVAYAFLEAIGPGAYAPELNSLSSLPINESTIVVASAVVSLKAQLITPFFLMLPLCQIGRASCRERVSS
jgi:hypothetical protein